MTKYIDIIKEEFNIGNKTGEPKKFSFKKLLILVLAGVLVTNFLSPFVGKIIFAIGGLYTLKDGIIPLAKKGWSKLVDFGKKVRNTYNKIKESKQSEKKKKFSLFKSKDGKKFTLFKSKKKKIEKEEILEETAKEIQEENVEEKENKKIPNIIKNLKLFCTAKFKFNLKVKKDVNGCKIVNGSYRIKGHKIIDNKIYLDTFEPVVENETEYSDEKIYVKTK